MPKKTKSILRPNDNIVTLFRTEKDIIKEIKWWGGRLGYWLNRIKKWKALPGCEEDVKRCKESISSTSQERNRWKRLLRELKHRKQTEQI